MKPIDLLQEEAERVVAEARKEAQAAIAEAKSSTQEEQNKKLAEVKAVSARALCTHQPKRTRLSTGLQTVH